MRLILRRRRRRLGFLVLLVVVLAALVQTARAEPQKVSLPDGRYYLIDLPKDPKGARLILALHGGGGNPEQFANGSGLGPAGVAQGYAVAFPGGSGRLGRKLLTWNSGYCCGYAMDQRVDDLAFLRAVIADAQDRFGLYQGPVYLTGMSNGSMMVEAFAATYPRQVSAVAGVSGTMDVDRFDVAGRVPLLVIHGTADDRVPYEGGVGARAVSGTDFASVAAVVDAFLAPWGARLATESRVINQKADGTRVLVTDYLKGQTVALRLMAVEGGGHRWPGKTTGRRTEGQTQEIEGNVEVLKFFALHP